MNARFLSVSVMIALLSLFVPGCEPREILYQVVEFAALSDSLRGDGVKVDLFRRPKPGKSGHTQTQNRLLAEFGKTNFRRGQHYDLDAEQALAGLKTVRVSTPQVTVEHLYSETFSWSWCYSTWAIENHSNHELKLDTALCCWTSQRSQEGPRKLLWCTQKIETKELKFLMGDDVPFPLVKKEEATRVDKDRWPILTISPNGRTAVTFGFETFHSDDGLIQFALRDDISQRNYEYKFRLKD